MTGDSDYHPPVAVSTSISVNIQALLQRPFAMAEKSMLSEYRFLQDAVSSLMFESHFVTCRLFIYSCGV